MATGWNRVFAEGSPFEAKSTSFFVTPAEAGVQNAFISLDSGFRRNDGPCVVELGVTMAKSIGYLSRIMPGGKR